MSKPKIEREVEIPLNILKALLTPSEEKMVKQRYLIIESLNQGLSVRAISEKFGVGTDTVVRVTKMVNSSPKLRALVSKKRNERVSKWVFGQGVLKG